VIRARHLYGVQHGTLRLDRRDCRVLRPPITCKSPQAPTPACNRSRLCTHVRD